MKTLSHFITLFSLLAFSWPSAAQTLSPPSKEVAPSSDSSGVVSDGIAVYRGQAYLLRNGRAAMVNRALVPEGQFLTWEGGLSSLPTGFSVYDNVAAEHDGFMVFHGQTFWLHHGKAALLNNTVVPEGQVLTAGGQLVPLPPDFSGFIRERTSAGTAGPLTSDLGTQALPNQAGVPQIHQGTNLQPSSVSSSPATGINPGIAGANGEGALSNPAVGGATSNSSAPNADGNILGQGYLPVGGVSPISGVHTIPGTTAAHLTNGATRTTNGKPPGSTTATPVGSVPRDNGTKAPTVRGTTIIDAPATPSTTSGGGGR